MMTSNASHHPYFASGHVRAQLVTLLLVVNILLGLAAAASDYTQMQLVSELIDGRKITLTEAEANDSRQQAIATIQLILFLATAIAFLIWIHRARRNLPALGAQNLEYSQGWAVGGFFVPLLNLARPYQVVKEIWKASDPHGAIEDALAWQHAPASPAIGWWWIMWLASGIVGRVASSFLRSTATLDDLLTGSGVLVVTDALTILAALLALRVVRGIDSRQTEKYRLLSSRSVQPEFTFGAPSDPEAAQEHLERGLTYASTGDYDYAIAEYSRAIVLHPQLAEAFCSRALAYQAKEDYGRALADYDLAITLDPARLDAYYSRGVLYGDKRDYARAIADFDHVIASNRQDPDAYYNRAIAYANNGDHGRAIHDLQQAIALDPELKPEAEALLAKLTHHL